MGEDLGHDLVHVGGDPSGQGGSHHDPQLERGSEACCVCAAPARGDARLRSRAVLLETAACEQNGGVVPAAGRDGSVGGVHE